MISTIEYFEISLNFFTLKVSIPNSPLKSFYKYYFKLISTRHTNTSPKEKLATLPSFILPNKYASWGVWINPDNIPGKVLQAKFMPCPEEHPVIIKSIALLLMSNPIKNAISVYE